MKTIHIPSVSVCVLLVAQACKYTIQSPIDTSEESNEALGDFYDYLTTSKARIKVQESKTSLPTNPRHKRVKRFQGGNTSSNPDVGIIYLDDGTRIHPYDPIRFQGPSKAHFTREQLIWEKIYQILRKRGQGQGSIPPVAQGTTRQDLLECTVALRAQSVRSESLPSKCANFISPGSGGGFQHSHPSHTPYFPNVPQSSVGFPHSHPGSSSVFPGFPPTSSGHVHGNNGFSHHDYGHFHGNNGHTHGSTSIRSRFGSQRPPSPTQSFNSNGHFHISNGGNDAPPIIFG